MTDSGIGMPPDVQARLFKPFVQADGSTTRQFGGTGLGLAISRELVALMGGEISLYSMPGEGSVFQVRLPLLHADQPEPRQDQPVAIALGAGFALLAGCTVLLVEDNAVNRDVAEAILARFDVNVLVATNGAQAVEAVTRNTCHLVLMDCQMPHMDGFEATHAIRQLEMTRDFQRTGRPDIQRLPIVALTANAMKGDRERCIAA